MEGNLTLLYLCIMCAAIGTVVAWEEHYFTAAVYQHPRWGDDTPASPSVILKRNLEMYGKAAKEAKLRGADMIVYPEYGIFKWGDRQYIEPYLEKIPDPKVVTANPCNESYSFRKRPILHILSCFAQSNKIVIVANTGGFEECTGHPDCPPDGRWNFNANVVFDKDGTLLARYYKEKLYFEDGMDLPRAPQDPFFKTEFGKFATFICFDIMFGKMAKIGKMENIDAIAFSTLWTNFFPFYTSTQWWQAWAIGSNMTIMTSNIQQPENQATGGGIYSGKRGAAVSSMSTDGFPKILIARVPRGNRDVDPQPTIVAFTERGNEELEDGDGKFHPNCSHKIPGAVKDVYSDDRCYVEDLSRYSLARLENTEGQIRVCSNGMCCYLEYAAKSMDEEFYVGVHNGTHNVYDRYYWAEENCFVARCDEVDGVPCSIFTTISNTMFEYLHLSANFSTSYVYPSVIGSQYKLMQYSDWNFLKTRNGSSLEFKTGAGFPLLTATLAGRAYDRDPRYIR